MKHPFGVEIPKLTERPIPEIVLTKRYFEIRKVYTAEQLGTKGGIQERALIEWLWKFQPEGQWLLAEYATADLPVGKVG